MKTFTYVIKDPIGLHARPAGLLAKQAKHFSSRITVTKGERSAEADRLIALMGLGIKQGEQITVTADGADENEAAAAMEAFFQENL